MKICVYAITKNEEKFVKRFLDSITEANYVVICDTGSTDETLDNIDAWKSENKTIDNVTVHRIHISPWRFDDARNASLSLVPADVDVCICMDLDEVMEPGWRRVIADTWELGKTTRLWYRFDWSNGLVFRQEKIHARHGYRWKYPVHEQAHPYGIEQVYAETDKLLFRHLPDDTKSRASYLPLLKQAVEESPNDAKNVLYYGRELMFNKQWGDGIRWCHKFLKMPDARWDHERQYAWRIIGECYVGLDLLDAAENAFNEAGRELPHGREHLFELAKIAEARKDWGMARGYALDCLDVKEQATAYTVDPKAWGWRPHDIAAISSYHLGHYDEALSQGMLALTNDLSNQQLIDNMKFYQEKAGARK